MPTQHGRRHQYEETTTHVSFGCLKEKGNVQWHRVKPACRQTLNFYSIFMDAIVQP